MYRIARWHAQPRLEHRSVVDTPLAHRCFLLGHMPAIICRNEPLQRSVVADAPRLHVAGRTDGGAPTMPKHSDGVHCTQPISDFVVRCMSAANASRADRPL